MSEDLIAFVKARLDEDEAAAKAAAPGPWLTDSEECCVVTAERDEVAERCQDESARHIARHDPARVLREVTAKRAILAEHFAEDRGESLPGADCGVCYCIGAPGSPARWPCLTLRAVAAVWSDHPDYRPEWKP